MRAGVNLYIAGAGIEGVGCGVKCERGIACGYGTFLWFQLTRCAGSFLLRMLVAKGRRGVRGLGVSIFVV